MKIDTLLSMLPENYTPLDKELILKAYHVAEEAHRGQTRASGEPYINHCVAVAGILAEMHVPPQVLVAALLHDTVEDTNITLDQIREQFGANVALLVDGVTKLTNLPRVSRGDQQSAKIEEEKAVRELAERRGLPDPDSVAEQISRSRKYDLVSETLRKTFLAMGEDVNVVLIKLADRFTICAH